jgi:hypothetical protein
MHHDILIHPAEDPGDRDAFLALLAEILVRLARSDQQLPDEPAADSPAPKKAPHERPAAA